MKTAPPVGTTQFSGHVMTPDEFHYPGKRWEQPDFVEYPKWINMTGYEPVLAYDSTEECVYLARPEREPLPPKGRKIVSSRPIPIQSIPPPVPVMPPEVLAWWRRSLLWLAHKLEALARI